MLLHAFVAISCLAAPMPEADQIFLDAALPGVVLGPGTDEQATAAWLPLERRTQLFEMVGWDMPPMSLVTEPTTRAMGEPVGSTNGGWLLSANGNFFGHLRKADNGTIAEPTLVSHDLGLIVRLNPPEPILIPELKAGEDRSMSIRVRMYDLHEPVVMALSGTRNITFTDMGMWRIKVPAGTFNARLVRTKGTNTVAGETFESLRYLFYARGEGLVAIVDTKPITQPVQPVKGVRAAVLMKRKPTATTAS